MHHSDRSRCLSSSTTCRRGRPSGRHPSSRTSSNLASGHLNGSASRPRFRTSGHPTNENPHSATRTCRRNSSTPTNDPSARPCSPARCSRGHPRRDARNERNGRRTWGAMLRPPAGVPARTKRAGSSGRKRRTPRPKAGCSHYEIRRRPTLPGGLPPSTIGADRLNFRVRDGNGCDPVAMVTEISCQRGVTLKDSRASTSCSKPSPRPISTGRLNVLPRLHLRPINVMVSSRALLRLPHGNAHLHTGFPLRCFQRLSLP